MGMNRYKQKEQQQQGKAASNKPTFGGVAEKTKMPEIRIRECLTNPDCMTRDERRLINANTSAGERDYLVKRAFVI